MRLWLFAVLAGCAGENNFDVMEPDTGEATGSGDEDTGDGGEQSETARAYWALDADLAMVDGLPLLEGSTLGFTRREEGVDDCVDSVAPSAVLAKEALPHESVYTWWQLDWDPSGLSCFSSGEAPTRGSILLGVGAMHVEVQALIGRLDEVDDAAVAASLNGAYATLPGDGRLLVFGAAGPPEAYSGEVQPAEAAPLADGGWWVRAVYPFNLD